MKSAYDTPEALDATAVPAASGSQNVSGNGARSTRLSRFRDRHARLDFTTTPGIKSTVSNLAQHLDCSKNDVMNSLVRFALTNRNWKQAGLYGTGATKQAGHACIDMLFLNTGLFCLFAAVLCWVGPTVLDGHGSTSTGGAHTTTHQETLSAHASRLADIALCQHLHGPAAYAMQLPDGQHRCTDKHGRRLSTTSSVHVIHALEIRP